MTTDIDFPEMPERIKLSDYEEENTYKNVNCFQTTSILPLKIQSDNQQVREEDFDHYNLNELDKKVLINELSDCDMYLKNIHTGFGLVGSTNSLIKLVMAGIGVHKHRRQVLKDLRVSKAKTLEFDENGLME